jgi:hypothetical protein
MTLWHGCETSKTKTLFTIRKYIRENLVAFCNIPGLNNVIRKLVLSIPYIASPTAKTFYDLKHSKHVCAYSCRCRRQSFVMSVNFWKCCRMYLIPMVVYMLLHFHQFPEKNACLMYVCVMCPSKQFWTLFHMTSMTLCLVDSIPFCHFQRL